MGDPTGTTGEFSQQDITEIANHLVYFADKMRTTVACMESYGLEKIATTNSNAPKNARAGIGRWLKAIDRAIEDHMVNQTEILQIKRR